MVKIYTDKFSMDGYLTSNVEFLYKRKTKKWDNLIIIDGDERAGKTTISQQIGYVYSIMNKSMFSVNNIFFNPEKMFNYAYKNKNDIIIWDEAAMGGLSTEWQNKVQQLLIKMLMTCGKYNHLYIFIIPKFKRINAYLGLDRSIALIRVYSPDNIERGYFRFYNKTKKEKLYHYEKQNMYKRTRMSYPNFIGRFVNTEGMIIDEDKYQEKKDQAISSLTQSPRDDMWRKRTYQLVNFAKSKGIKVKDIAKFLGMTTENIYKEAKKYGKITG